MHGDPPQHDEPSPHDDSPAAIKARHRQTFFMLGGVVLVAAALLGTYLFFSQPAPEPGTGETLSARQIADVARPLIGKLHTYNIGGDSRFAGLAVTTGEGQMATTCHSLPSSGPLSVAFHDGTSRAESARIDRTTDVCLIKVQTTGRTSAKVRDGEPANGEKVYVVSLKNTKDLPTLIETRVKEPIAEVPGMAFILDTKEELVTGAAVFDRQGRLAGIVTDPHKYGNVRAALSASRIAKMRAAQRPRN